jgi:hypothetical protein
MLGICPQLVSKSLGNAATLLHKEVHTDANLD